jgi:uncharacterized protein with PIN domain
MAALQTKEMRAATKKRRKEEEDRRVTEALARLDAEWAAIQAARPRCPCCDRPLESSDPFVSLIGTK